MYYTFLCPTDLNIRPTKFIALLATPIILLVFCSLILERSEEIRSYVEGIITYRHCNFRILKIRMEAKLGDHAPGPC